MLCLNWLTWRCHIIQSHLFTKTHQLSSKVIIFPSIFTFLWFLTETNSWRLYFCNGWCILVFDDNTKWSAVRSDLPNINAAWILPVTEWGMGWVVECISNKNRDIDNVIKIVRPFCLSYRRWVEWWNECIFNFIWFKKLPKFMACGRSSITND